MLCFEGEVVKEESNEDYVEAAWLPYSVFKGGTCCRAADVIDALKVSIWKVVATLDFAVI